MSNHPPGSLSDSSSNLDSAVYDDELQFAEETEPIQLEKSWKIMIVDDEAEVHDVTKLALSDFTFEGKSLTFISAYSGAEAKQLIQAHPDTAIIFLDVVMETENAGLEVIDYIRGAIANPIVRIILRTGQPGQAPEDVVAVNYGIDDYKTKTELTARKLFTTVVTALRGFSTSMQLLEMSRKLELAWAQHEQSDTEAQINDLPEHNQVHQLEGWLQALQHNLSQADQHEKLEALGQLVTGITHEIVNSSNQASALYLMSVMTRIARTVLRITDEHSARLGISQSKLAVLMYLSQEPAFCASPSSLAKHCGISRAAMTGLLDGLEQAGYVERDDHPSDRRALMVKLTPAGQQFLQWLIPQSQGSSDPVSPLSNVERQNLAELVMEVVKLLEHQPVNSPDQE